MVLGSVRALKPKVMTGYEVILLGSPCHSADLAKPVKKLLLKMEPSPGARFAGFVTHSIYTPEGERERKLHEQWAGKCTGSFEQACAAKGLVWSGYFSCQGAPSKPIEILIRHAAIKDPAEWPAYIAEIRKHPDVQDEARAFARGVVERFR